MTEAALPVAIRVRPQSRGSSVRWFLRKNPRMLVGVVLLSILLFVAAFAPFIAPIWMPMIVTTGMSAFFSAWRITTARSRRPLARAVRM